MIDLFKLCVFCVELDCSLIHFLLQFTRDLIFQPHVYFVLMNDSSKSTIAHVFENTNSVAEGEREQEHFYYKAEVQTVMQRNGEGKHVEVYQTSNEESGKEDSVGHYKETCRSVASPPNCYCCKEN